MSIGKKSAADDGVNVHIVEALEAFVTRYGAFSHFVAGNQGGKLTEGRRFAAA
jgi:hypothetical protein